MKQSFTAKMSLLMEIEETDARLCLNSVTYTASSTTISSQHLASVTIYTTEENSVPT